MTTGSKVRLTPVTLPVIYFLSVILIGTFLLMAPFSYVVTPPGFINALFTSTSAVCVTGLAVLDTGTEFTRTGQTVIMMLIQMGGLGIMTFTSLAIYLVTKRISFTDHMAVGQALMQDTSFHLGRFLKRIFVFTFVIEGAGAAALFLLNPDKFSPFSAVFHAVSAFCNAGFSLFSDSLMSMKGDWGINIVFMALIILGGLGFAVLLELQLIASKKLHKSKDIIRISWHTEIVLKTSAMLIIAGAVFFFFTEAGNTGSHLSLNDRVLTSLFQSVTARTAGFNTLDIGKMTNVSLLFLIMLMFIGGAPGSCAGGVKVTTFRVLLSFIGSQAKGHHQTFIGRFAVEKSTLNKAITLLFFSALLIFVSILILDFLEGGNMSHLQARGQFIELAFEAVSAFGTVGLSTGITAKLTVGGKLVIILLMYIGRLGPLVFLAVLQAMRNDTLYSKPEEILGIG